MSPVKSIVLTPEQIKTRSIKGVVAFTIRTVLLYIITVIATGLLAAFLDASEFGIFYYVSSTVNLFTFLSDIGLAASLIQKKDAPSQSDLETTFTVQQFLSLVIFGLIALLTPLWQRHLNHQGLYLLYALGASFFLASLKTIPSILLERQLNFNKLIIPQIIETIVFYTAAVFLAWKGFGVTSYTIAVISRAVIGVIVIYLLQSWRIRFSLNRQSLSQLLGFGFKFQLNDLLARIKDDLLIVSMKKLLTDTEIGYIGLAKQISFFPFNFSVQNVIRITFPAYSRLQHDTVRLKKAIEKSLFFIACLIFPILAGIAALAYPITQIIPNYQKWQPALPALYLFLINIGWASISTPLTNAINAIGKIQITLKLMIFWTSLTWVLTIPLVIKIGFIAVPLVAAIVASTSVITIFIMKKIVNISVLKNTLPQLIASLIMLIILINLQSFLVKSIINLALGVLLGILIYFAAILVFLRQRVFLEINTVLKTRHE